MTVRITRNSRGERALFVQGQPGERHKANGRALTLLRMMSCVLVLPVYPSSGRPLHKKCSFSAVIATVTTLFQRVYIIVNEFRCVYGCSRGPAGCQRGVPDFRQKICRFTTHIQRIREISTTSAPKYPTIFNYLTKIVVLC